MPLVNFAFHWIGNDLKPAMFSFASYLFLYRETFAKRHGYKLPDIPFGNIEAVQPRLVRNDNVVLRIAGEPVRPHFARNSVDLACRDFDGAGVVA